MRYKPKYNASVHGRKRFEQRYDGKESVEAMCNKALHYGIFVHQVPKDSPLLDYMENKIYYRGKKVKLLEGYVFVFSKSNRLITMYPIPEDMKEHYEEVRHIEGENKEKWKKQRNQKDRWKYLRSYENGDAGIQ